MDNEPEATNDAKSRTRTRWAIWLGLAAVIGIIVAVLLPSYADYTHRIQASEAVSLLSSAKAPAIRVLRRSEEVAYIAE